MDINQLQLDDCWYNEGTICLVNKLMGARGMVFRAWAHKQSPLNSQWLVLRLVAPISSIVGLLILYG